MNIEIDMPQMSLNGLSENWLFKYCGNLVWKNICEGAGQKSRDLVDTEGRRLYSTFFAISARYSIPLSAVGENDSFRVSTNVSRFGNSYFHGVVTLENDAAQLSLELLTAFVVRIEEGRNALLMSEPASGIVFGHHKLAKAPDLLVRAKQTRGGDLLSYDLDGIRIDLSAKGATAQGTYNPSPYTDFNGANLLYFAAYPTIFDTMERRLIMQHELVKDPTDWAQASSTLARDIYYLGNLDLGRELDISLNCVSEEAGFALIHSTMRATADGAPMAIVFTKKKILEGG
jgi:probable biosynthetic protein (TIGR04098 family)